MKSSWTPNPSDLDEYARRHLEYEARVLTGQMSVLASNPTRDVQMDALIEAVLVHLRLWDEFLGRPDQMDAGPTGGHDDVFAGHWDASYAPSRFLLPDERSDINAHVAHMSARRSDVLTWDLTDMTARACAHILGWVAGVQAVDPARSRALSFVDRYAAEYLRKSPPAFIPADLP